MASLGMLNGIGVQRNIVHDAGRSFDYYLVRVHFLNTFLLNLYVGLKLYENYHCFSFWEKLFYKRVISENTIKFTLT